MTNPIRIVGDKQDTEAFIPGVWSKSLVDHLNAGHGLLEAFHREEMSTEAGRRRAAERQRAAAEAAREKATAEQRVLDRHAELVATTTEPTLARLLGEHEPHRTALGLECHGCPADHDTDHEGFVDALPQDAPCPTWLTIAGGAP